MEKSIQQLIFEALKGSLSAQVKAIGYSSRYIVVTVNGSVHHLKVE